MDEDGYLSVFPGQYSLGAFEQRDLRAHPGEQLGELDADRPGTHDGHRGRQRRQVYRLHVGDVAGLHQPWNEGWLGLVRTGGDDSPARPQHLTFDVDFVGRLEPRLTAEERHARLSQSLRAVVARDAKDNLVFRLHYLVARPTPGRRK